MRWKKIDFMALPCLIRCDSPGSTRTIDERSLLSIGTGGPSSTCTVHPSASSSTRRRAPCRCIRNVTRSHVDGKLGVNRSAVPESNSPANPKTIVPHTPPVEATCAPSLALPWVSARSTNSASRK